MRGQTNADAGDAPPPFCRHGRGRRQIDAPFRRLSHAANQHIGISLCASATTQDPITRGENRGKDRKERETQESDDRRSESRFPRMGGATRNRQQRATPSAAAAAQPEEAAEAMTQEDEARYQRRRRLVFRCAAMVVAVTAASLLGVVSRQFAMAITVLMYATVRFGARR